MAWISCIGDFLLVNVLLCNLHGHGQKCFLAGIGLFTIFIPWRNHANSGQASWVRHAHASRTRTTHTHTHQLDSQGQKLKYPLVHSSIFAASKAAQHSERETPLGSAQPLFLGHLDVLFYVPKKVLGLKEKN
jgi:hypothetical protein